MSTRQPQFLGDGVKLKHSLSAKLSFFRNRTDHLLESILAQSGGSGLIVQDGWERRHGTEQAKAKALTPPLAIIIGMPL